MKTRKDADLLWGAKDHGDEEITFNADEGQPDLAKRIAEEKGTTLEEEVRQWLKDFGEGRWKLTPKEPKTLKGGKSAK